MNLDSVSRHVKACEHEIKLNDQTQTAITVFNSEIIPSNNPLFLILPALGVRGSYYERLASIIASLGFTAVTMDLRGTGKSNVEVNRRTRFGYHEILTVDLPEIFNFLRSNHPGKPIFMIGHSLGGQIGLLFAALNPQVVDGVVLVAAGSNYYKNLGAPRKFGRYVNLNLIHWITVLYGYFPGDKIGFAGKESKTMITDWLHEAMTGKYLICNNPNDFENLLARINLPVLFISLVGDIMVTAKCAEFLAEKLKSARVKKIELDAQDYDLKRFSHFNWLKNPVPIIENIQAWLSQINLCF